jgi:hypothetical protein
VNISSTGRLLATGVTALKRVPSDGCLLAATLAVGAWVRLTGLDLGWFLQDQVRDGMAALGILSGREFPLLGPQAALSTVNLVGPFYYYLLALPYGVNPNPIVGVGFINLLNLLSIYVTYRLGTEMFGRPVGLVAAALYAVFPMAVLSGKALWNPGFIPFFSTLFLLALWRFLVGRRPWALTPVLFLLGMLLQIHMSGAIFVVLLPVALLLYRPPLRRWPLLVGLASVGLLYVPYVLFQVQHGFPDAQKLFAWAGNNPAVPAWLIAWWGFWTPFLLPERLVATFPGDVSPILFAVVQRTELVLLALGIVALVTLVIKARDRRPYILLALWFALPFIIVPHNKIAVMWYYFDILYPAQFLIIGLLSQTIVGDGLIPSRRGISAPNGCRLALVLLAGTTVAVQVWFMMSFERAVKHTGVFNFTADIVVNFPDPGPRVMATMPLGYKRALAKRFLNEFGVEHAILERRGHGAMYQLFREDKGFLFQTLAPRLPNRPFDPALQYLIIRDDLQVSLEQEYEERVGAYRIVAYHPMLRYESWRWSVSPQPGWRSEEFDDSAWTASPLPARVVPDPAVYAAVPYVRWAAKTLAFRGWMEAASAGQPVWLVLNIRDSPFFPHEVKGLTLNGQLISPLRTVAHDSINCRNIEVTVDVTTVLRAGANLVAFEITGANGEFDLDLYELRLAMHAEAR